MRGKLAYRSLGVTLLKVYEAAGCIAMAVVQKGRKRPFCVVIGHGMDVPYRDYPLTKANRSALRTSALTVSIPWEKPG